MIESRHDPEPCGTTKSAPPRPCARIETASCTSTLTESSEEAGEPKPSSDSTTAGQAGKHVPFFSNTFFWAPLRPATLTNFAGACPPPDFATRSPGPVSSSTQQV